MRRILCCSLVLLFAILVCGCTQPAAQPPVVTVTPTATPVPTQVTLPPATAATATVQKHLNFTVSTTDHELIIRYNGGPDAADVTALKVRVDNHNSQDIELTIAYPVIGKEYPFAYKGIPDPNVVNIVGVFTGGYEQTVLMYYV